MEESKKDSHVPVLPFDSSMRDSFITYDNQIYVRDRDLCPGPIDTESENIVKYYSYKLDTEAESILCEDSDEAAVS